MTAMHFLSVSLAYYVKPLAGEKKSSMDQASLVSTIPCRWKLKPSYYHSFGMTENYFIFVEQPFVLNLKTFMLNLFIGKSYMGATEWYGKEKVSGASDTSKGVYVIEI